MANNTRDEIIRYIFDALGGEKIDSIKDSIKKAGEESEKAGTLFEFLEKHLAAIVSIATLVEVALKGIEFGKESLKSVEDVEASLSRVKALAGDASEAFGEMGEEVEKAATAVNVSSETSASGLAKLVENGLSAKDAIAALVPTLQLAKIANIDVGTAAAEVAQQLKAFNRPASDAQLVVDQLTASSHGAAGGLAAMSGAATQLAPDAKALGLEFTDVVSILGLLNSKGLDTEKSVRGLRAVFQELQNPASTLRGELLALGDGTNDFAAAIAALTSGTPRANDALLTLNGPARSLVQVLGQAGPEAIAAFNAELQKTQGIAAKTASVIDDNLKGAAFKFENAISSIGERLAKPVLEPFTKELEKLAKELNDWAESADFKEIEDAAVTMAKNAAKAIDDFLHGIDWKTFASNGKDAIKGLADDLDAMAQAASTVATVVGKAGDVVGGTYHAIGVAVDGLVAGGAKAADAVVTVTERVGDLTGKLPGAQQQLDGMHNALQSVGDVASGNLVGHLEKLGADIVDLAGGAEKAATSTKAHGDAAATAAPKVEQHAKATHDAAAAANEAATVLPTMTVRLGQASDQLPDFVTRLNRTAAGLDEVSGKAGKAVVSAESLKTAFEKLGISSQQHLEDAARDAAAFFATIDKGSADTAAGLADRQNAFLAYAKAALAASVQLDYGAKASLQAQLESKAAVLGVTAAMADLEAQSAASSAALVSDADRSAAALRKEFDEADRLAKRLGGGGDDGVSVAESAGQAGDAVQGAAERGADALSTLTSFGAGTREALLNVSDAAAKAFDYQLLHAWNNEFDATGIGFTRYISAVNTAVKATNEFISEQRTQLQGIIDRTNTIGTESVEDFARLGSTVKNLNENQLTTLIASIKEGTYDAGLLGKQELQPLLAALEAAKQRVDDLTASEKRATEQIQQLNGELQNQIDQQNNNQTAIENRSYETQKKNIEDLAAQADEAGKQQAAQALQRLEEVHQANLRAIAEQAAAQQKSVQQQKQQTNNASGGGGSYSAGGSQSGNSSASGLGGSIKIDVNLNGANVGSAGARSLSESDIQSVMQQLGPQLLQQIIAQLRAAGSRA